MEIKIVLKKIPFWTFCILMVILFLTGIAYPRQTDYWIIKNAYPILMFEFLSIFTTVFLLGFRINKDKIAIGFVLSLSLLIAYTIAKDYNIWLILYFIVSIVVKYIAYKRIESIFKATKILENVMISAVPFLFSAMLGLMTSPVIKNVYSRQIDLIIKSEQELIQKHDYSENGIAFIVAWGITYFILACLFDIIKMIYDRVFKETTVLED